MTIGVYGPQTPEKTGVAEYIETSLSSLTRLGRCTHVSNSVWSDPWSFDAVLYHLGNNQFHHCAFKALPLRSGPLILHEYNNIDYYLQTWRSLSSEIQAVGLA